MTSLSQRSPRTVAGPVAERPHETARSGLYPRLLILLFLLTLPFANPWVHGDGVGYYAYARALLIEHRLDFRYDWLHADPEFRSMRTDAQGRLTPGNYTATGHIDNHWSIGPAILWSPFLIAAHAGVLAADAIGAHVAADGYSRPYLLAMAFGTAVYGFLGLWISFLIARSYVAERWAFLATVGIWAASSLPVYMYFNPSWSHAQSVFAAALFIWYWLRTRAARTWAQWTLLGLIGGLMMNIRYTDGILFLFPLLESLRSYWKMLRSRSGGVVTLFWGNVLFSIAIATALLPTLISKKIIYGGYLASGYKVPWFWNSPAFFKACFSSDHGMFSWTPILLLGTIGILFLRHYDRTLAIYSAVAGVAYVYLLGCYGPWDGKSSFGNRYFISLTPIFILGLAALFDALGRTWKARRAFALATSLTAVLVLWNFGMMYQWGMHLIPVRGPISWRVAVYNQFTVVPSDAAGNLKRYFLRRGNLMRNIENEDTREVNAASH